MRSSEVEPQQKSVPPDWPKSSDDPKVKAAVLRRSGGRCEAGFDGCQHRAVHRHHRKRRTHGDHRPVNLAHLCHACHDFIHANTGWARDHGWLLRGTDDPELVPTGAPRAPTG